MNKTNKILNTIGVILFGVLCISMFSIGVDTDTLSSIGILYSDIEDSFYAVCAIAMIAIICGLVLSICGLFIPSKIKKDKTTELLELGQLKEKGILSDEEFEAKKRDLLA